MIRPTYIAPIAEAAGVMTSEKATGMAEPGRRAWCPAP